LQTNKRPSPRQLSDEVLVARVAHRDTEALEILYDRYAAIVLGVCLQITGDHGLAENVLQETFWQVWQSAIAYQNQKGSFTSWLFRIARELAKGVTTTIE
jgi:RNA polymerase sigma-70 factor, ECF subfamily